MAKGDRQSPLHRSRHCPRRTCIGCRKQLAASQLTRFVARDEIDKAGHHRVRVVVDSARRLPGRGAWLHPSPECAELAERRKAWGRALKVTGTIDIDGVAEAVTAEQGCRAQRPK